ncbi:MAG: hypothetical protein IJK19_07220 [Bacteroidales bacterium]|nr:hypothetical protein [Bacteroidales bacterium]
MKKLQILLLAILLSAPVYAQIDPTVVVDREFEGKIDVDVRMPQTPLTVADSLKKFDVSFDYSIFDRPFRDLYEFSPYQAASLGVVPPKAVPHFSARVASQYPLMPEVDLFGQLVPKKNPNVNFGLFVKYASEAGKIPAMNQYIGKLDARRLRMSAGAFFKYAWEKGELSLLGSYRTSYARDELDARESLVATNLVQDSAKHYVNAYEADFKIRSTNVKDHEFYYDIDASFVRSAKDLEYRSTVFDPYTFSETALNIDAEFGSSFEEHRMYVDVRSQNNWYDQLGGYYLGIIEFAPIYRYSKGRFDGRFGIRFSNSFAGDNSTSIYPDVDAKFELAENKLWIRAVANGGRNIDNLGFHLETAPWLMMGLNGGLPASIQTDAELFKMRYTTRPIDAKLSFEGIIGSRLGINVYGTYTSFKDRMLLYSGQFYQSLPFVYPEFVDYAKLSAGVELTWTSKDLRVFTSVQGNKYNSESQLFMLPKIESLSQIEYNFKERLFLSTALVIQGERESMFGMPAYLPAASLSQDSQRGRVPAYLDLSAKAEFKVNRFFSVYIKGGNLLNKENYIFAGIGSMPINGGGGICINF